MRRDIKFRAWGIDNKRMWFNVQNAYDMQICHNKPECKGYCGCEDVHFYPSSFGEVLEDADFIVMQYTGLKDKNGKEIYEGDVIKHHKYNGALSIVEWNQPACGWGLSGEDKRFMFLSDMCCKNIEVIGNIYENKKLLTLRN